jgi:hypothetical protein
MTSEILRAVIFGIAIVALIPQLVYDLVQSREKKETARTSKPPFTDLKATTISSEPRLTELKLASTS